MNLIVAGYFRTVKAAFNVVKIYKSLHATFNITSHREIFEATQRVFYPKEHMMAASSLTVVRWACKFEGVNRRFQAIPQSLQKISYTNFSHADSVAGLYHKTLSGKFVICLCLVHKVLSILDGLSKLLQEINTNWITACSEMVAVRKLLVEIEIDEIIEIATKLCSTVGITIHYEDPLSNTMQIPLRLVTWIRSVASLRAWTTFLRQLCQNPIKALEALVKLLNLVAKCCKL